MLASWKLPKIPSYFDMVLFFNLPWSIGSSGNFLENSQSTGKLETFQNLLRFRHGIIFQLPWVYGKFPELPGTSFGLSRNAGKLGNFQNIFGFWHGSIFQLPWVNPGTSFGIFAGKFWNSQNPLDFHMAFFTTFLGQWEVSNIRESWELPKIPLDFDLSLFFSFPGSKEKFPDLRGTSFETSKNAGKLGTSQNPFVFDMALFQLP